MHDVVVDALGRIDAAEEAAAMDREPKRRKGHPSSPPWAIESPILGHVQQSDIPKLLMDEIAKASLIKGGVTALARKINLVSPKVLKDYAAGNYKMPYTTGRHFINYLEEQAKKSGATPAATDATPKNKATEQAPAPIVPQPAQDDKTTDLQARIAELVTQNTELKIMLDTAKAKLASVQGREMTELEDELETLRRRVAHYEADDAACGPARVEELEDRLSRIQDEHVRDLELIRDLTRQLVARSAC